MTTQTNNELATITTELAKFDAVDAGIAALQSAYKGVIYDCTTTKGMTEAVAARKAIKEPRIECEKIRKAIKAPILELGKQIDTRAKSITASLEALEEPIDQQIKKEEARKEEERQKRIKAEEDRVAAIQRRIDAIRAWPTNATGKPSSLVAAIQREADAYVIGADFAEFGPMAEQALVASRAALRGIHTERLQHEAEQARIEEERRELEKLRAEQAVRDAEAKRIQDEETARQQAELRKERERLDAEKAAQDAEAARLRAEREELERQRQPVAAPVEPPKTAPPVGMPFARLGRPASQNDVVLFEITDPDLVPRAFCMVDLMKIQAEVSAKGMLASIPGVRVYSEKRIASGAA